MTAVAFDTNILVYAAGVGDAAKCEAAASLLARVGTRAVVPVQVIGEFFNVLVRKVGMTPRDVQTRIDLLTAGTHLVDTTAAVLDGAVGLATAHRLQIWDAVVVAAAEQADCTVLLSEDMQHGFTWRRITVVDPLAHADHPLLVRAAGP
ncbi:PIN domain-containing protein [Methyloraptor flagellatus]|jgi:predicted nucleic acid-binding protein|uniref:PIN domain-containing protein n=1 Tax=Methyloraptor flagellatus TaxID=3162530 RepID=A0AAU7X6D4_9HYPH